MNIVLASDHAGYPIRKRLAGYLESLGHTIVEHGAENDVDAYSYVPAGLAAVADIQNGTAHMGIVICGTGIGISMVCNKNEGVRCALCTDEFMARMAREHNDANVLALGARVIGQGLAVSITDAFLHTDFEAGGRHQARVTEIKGIEEKVFRHS